MYASIIGLSYSDLLELDIRKYNCMADGFIRRREISMNDSKLVGHLVAGKIAAAVWGDSSYKKPIQEITLREEEKNTIESRNARVIQCLKAKGIL